MSTGHEAEQKLTEDRLARASVLQELTVAALDLFDPRRSMDDFLERISVRLGCLVALCLAEPTHDAQSAQLLGASGLSRASRRLPVLACSRNEWASAKLPFPELARNDLVCWSFPVVSEVRSAGSCALLLFFEGGPRVPAHYHGMVQRLAEIVQTALLHRQLYARALESERRLWEQKTLLECQSEASIDGILFVASDGFVTCNRRFRTLFNLAEGASVSHREIAHRLMELSDKSEESKGLLELLLSSQGEHTAAEWRLADCRVFDVVCTQVKSAEGSSFGRSWYFRDITDRKRADEERAKLLAQEQTARAEAEDAQRRAAFLAEASRLLAGSLDYNATLERVAHLALPVFADWCVMDLVEDDHSLHRVAVTHVDVGKAEAAHRLRTHYPPRLASARGIPLVLRTGKPEFFPMVSDESLRAMAQDDEHMRLLKELGVTSAMMVPLIARGRRLGAITFNYGQSGRHYSEADLALAEDLACRAALAVDNAKLHLRTQVAVRTRDEFLSIASHELRTPITSLQLAVQGLLRLVRSDSLDKAPPDFVHASLDAAVRQSNRMAQLIDKLLDVSRIQAGRLDLQLERVDVASVVREMVSQFSAELAQAGCKVEIKSDGPVFGLWDRARVEQVVANLLCNAWKYGAGKPIEITVASDATTARMRVRDFGIGIPVERQHRLFERFERAVSSRNYSGLGLGLFIVRRVLEALGGTVRVESHPGEGSTFLVELPVAGPKSLESSAAEDPDREKRGAV